MASSLPHSKKVSAWVAPCLLVIAIAQVAWPLLTQTPLTGDHPVHLFKAWHFYEKMLPTLTVRGFSFYWVFGHPAGELVPFGEEVWVALVRALTWERFDWLRTYALAMFALIALIAGSAYIFTNRFFGPWVGLLAALLTLWDPGAWAQAGWEWFMTIGVWANSLGISFIILSVVALHRVAESPSRLRTVVAALAVAAAFLAHQIAIPFLPILLSLTLLDLWVRGALSGRGTRSALLAFALGLALSGFYVIPMMARSGLTLDLGVAGVSLTELGQRLVEERPFHNQWGPLATLGFVGAFLALRRRAPGAVLLSLGTGVFVLASTDVAFSTFRLERLMPGLTKIEAMRMLVGGKALWFPLVAYALAEPFAALARHFKGVRPSNMPSYFSRPRRRWLLPWALGIALVAPYVPGAAKKLYLTKIRKIVPDDKVTYLEDLKPIWQETSRLRQSSQDLYRVAYDLPMHNHIGTLAPLFDDTWIYKVGYTSTQAFWAFPMYFDVKLFEKLLVKYVVSTRELPADDFELLSKSGALNFYRFVHYRGEPFKLHGEGRVHLVEFAPERIQLKLQGTNQESRLELFVSVIDHWQAKYGEDPVAIRPATVQRFEDPYLMEVPARDGTVTLEYGPRASDRWGATLSVAALASLAAQMMPRNARRSLRQLLRPRLSPLWPKGLQNLRLSRLARWGLALGATLVIAGGLLQRLSHRGALVPKDSLFRRLAPNSLRIDGAACAEREPFFYQCGNAQLEATRVSGLYGSHVCFTSVDGKKLVLETSGTFSAIEGKYDVRPGSGSVRLTVNDEELPAVRSRNVDQGLQFLRFDLRRFGGGRLRLKLEVQGAPLHCFDFAGKP